MTKKYKKLIAKAKKNFARRKSKIVATSNRKLAAARAASKRKTGQLMRTLA